MTIPTATLDEGTNFEIVTVNEDESSATARLRAGGVSFLFAESTNAEDQGTLVRSDADPYSAVLIAPRAVSRDFCDAVNPQVAVFFGGRTAREKPSPDSLAALSRATVLQTSERGKIEMVVDGERVMVRW